MTRVSSCASPEPSGTSVSPGWPRPTAPLFFSETGIGQDKIQLRQSVNPGPAPCCSQVPLLWCLCSRREISTPSSSRRRRQMSSVGAAPARRRGHGSSLLAPPPVGARRDAGVGAAPARPAVYVYPRLLQRDRRAEAAAASISATVPDLPLCSGRGFIGSKEDSAARYVLPACRQHGSASCSLR